jgi:hypothetical protein
MPVVLPSCAGRVVGTYDPTLGPLVLVGLCALKGKPGERRRVHWCNGLVDTGNTITAISAVAASRAGIFYKGQMERNTAAGRGPSVVFEESDVFLGDSHPVRILSNVTLLETKHQDLRFDVLMGRDILSHCVLWLDGRTRRFIIRWWETAVEIDAPHL